MPEEAPGARGLVGDKALLLRGNEPCSLQRMDSTILSKERGPTEDTETSVSVDLAPGQSWKQCQTSSPSSFRTARLRM